MTGNGKYTTYKNGDLGNGSGIVLPTFFQKNIDTRVFII